MKYETLVPCFQTRAAAPAPICPISQALSVAASSSESLAHVTHASCFMSAYLCLSVAGSLVFLLVCGGLRGSCLSGHPVAACDADVECDWSFACHNRQRFVRLVIS